MAATKPPAGKAAKGGRNRRIIIALGLVALLVVGYLLYKSKSGSSTPNQLPVTGDTGASAASPSTDSGGSDSGGADPSAADILSALAGENQQLLGSLLSSQQGLLSLAGSSFGSTAQTTGAPQSSSTGSSSSSSGSSSPAPQAAPQAAAAAAPTGADQDVTQPLAAPGTAGNTTVNYQQNVPLSSNIAQEAQVVAGTFSGSSGPVVTSKPTNTIASGAAAVKSGAAKTNTQAKAKAL
jgi:hypothetical protein